MEKKASPVLNATWQAWVDLPWMTMPDAGGPVVQLCDRLLQQAHQAESYDSFLSSQLPELATQFSAQWVGLLQRTPAWTTLSECGRCPEKELPRDLFDDALDKDAGGYLMLDQPTGWSIMAISLTEQTGENLLLVFAGQNLAPEMLTPAIGVARAFSFCLLIAGEQDRLSKHINKLRSVLEIASTFAGARETQPLLELIAREATRLMECDRASIFLWDKEHKEVVACPALGVEGNTLRLPDNVGIVGEVIHSGETVCVEDAYNDPRFNQKVDKDSGYKTKNLMCGVLRDGEGEIVGAFEVINKLVGDFNTDDQETLHQLGIQVAIAVQNTREREQLTRSRENLTEQITQGVKIIGESQAIAGLRAMIVQVAPTELPVLIMGESGTGKEVVSQALHYQGPRANHPFVAVNCAALTETLLESELFGHERGAFTDAHEMREGKFELADGGTLFLDEMGEMSANGQAKLLRVLEQKVITRVGGSQNIPVNVRIVAATNVNLAQAVQERKFRADLYYRLSGVTMLLPALRERPEDILPLAEHFLKQFCVQANRKALPISAEARRRLQAHSWPGNVRELRNLMERVAFLAQGDRIEADDLSFILNPQQNSLEPSLDLGLKEASEDFQREYIRRAIKRVQGNMSEAARMLGLHRSNLYRKMRQLKMDELGPDEI